MNVLEKYEKLKEYINALGNLVVAFSGGVDSTFLLRTAFDVLNGNNVLAVIAKSDLYPERELNEAIDFAESLGVRYIVIKVDEININGFAENPIDRCYICKKYLFNEIKILAAKEGFSNIAEGSNYDDLLDYRPGKRAVEELKILSPLKILGFTKDDIRMMSKYLGLKTWDKPSYACLASRFPYGERITIRKLKMISMAEQFLFDLGFRQNRVRIHNDVARIELDYKDIQKLLEQNLREQIYLKLKEIGFIYVTLDLKGYRTGSMNESLILENENNFVNEGVSLS